MSDWESSGGAGGITARYDDLEALARVYGRAAGAVADVALDVGRIATSPVLLNSALFSPGSFGDVMGLLAELGLGPSGLAASGIELEVLALRLEAGVQAYRLADRAVADLITDAEDLAGFAIGLGAPALLVGVLGTESAVTLPGFVDDLQHGRAGLSSFPSRVLDATAEDANALLLAHPGAAQHVVGGAAGLETGLLMWVPGPLQDRLSLDGTPQTYEEALRNLGGLFRDGQPAVGPGGSQQIGDDVAPRSVTDLLAGVSLRQNRLGGAVSGEIGVQRLEGSGGVVRYVVQLPGTESWAVTPGPVARDLATNVHTMAGGHTVYMRGIEEAMARADIPEGAPVMLVGHSQGGMTAAALAADPGFRERFNVTQVVTAGAPVARFDVPGSVQVLAVENRHDLVPQLDGAPNKDRPNVTTLTFSADRGSLGANHSLLDTYQVATADLPSDDPSYAAWRESSDGFLDPGSRSTTSTYAITRRAAP